MRLHIALGRVCAYCKQPCPEPQPDHVIPVSRGGPNVLSNILPSCARCNGHKAARTPDEWNTYRATLGWSPVNVTEYVHLALVNAKPRAA